MLATAYSQVRFTENFCTDVAKEATGYLTNELLVMSTLRRHRANERSNVGVLVRMPLPGTEKQARAAMWYAYETSRKYTQMHARESVVFGFSQWRKLGPMHSY